MHAHCKKRFRTMHVKLVCIFLWHGFPSTLTTNPGRWCSSIPIWPFGKWLDKIKSCISGRRWCIIIHPFRFDWKKNLHPFRFDWKKNLHCSSRTDVSDEASDQLNSLAVSWAASAMHLMSFQWVTSNHMSDTKKVIQTCLTTKKTCETKQSKKIKWAIQVTSS